MIYHQMRTCHRLSACNGYICTALPVRSVVVAVLPFSCMYFCMYFKLTDHAFKIATHRARKEENAQSVRRQSKPEKGTKRTLLSRAPSIGACFCVRARLFSSSLSKVARQRVLFTSQTFDARRLRVP